MEKIDINLAFDEIMKCKREVQVSQVLLVFSTFLGKASEKSPMFMEAKELLGEDKYNALMNTLMFAISSKCLQLVLPKQQYIEFTKRIVVEEDDVCDHSKPN